MATLYNHDTEEQEDLAPEDEAKFGTDPEFVARYVPKDRKTRDHYRQLVGTGVAPHAAAMMALGQHTGKVDPSLLTAQALAIADIARRHTKAGPNGGSWESPHTPGLTTTTPEARSVTVHESAPPPAPEAPRTRPAPKPRATPKKAAKERTKEARERAEEKEGDAPEPEAQADADAADDES